LLLKEEVVLKLLRG